MSQDYLDKLEHIRGAVAHHVYEEEGTWFLELKEKASPGDQNQIYRTLRGGIQAVRRQRCVLNPGR